MHIKSLPPADKSKYRNNLPIQAGWGQSSQWHRERADRELILTHNAADGAKTLLPTKGRKNAENNSGGNETAHNPWPKDPGPTVRRIICPLIPTNRRHLRYVEE